MHLANIFFASQRCQPFASVPPIPSQRLVPLPNSLFQAADTFKFFLFWDQAKYACIPILRSRKICPVMDKHCFKLTSVWWKESTSRLLYEQRMRSVQAHWRYKLHSGELAILPVFIISQLCESLHVWHSNKLIGFHLLPYIKHALQNLLHKCVSGKFQIHYLTELISASFSMFFKN